MAKSPSRRNRDMTQLSKNIACWKDLVHRFVADELMPAGCWNARRGQGFIISAGTAAEEVSATGAVGAWMRPKTSAATARSGGDRRQRELGAQSRLRTAAGSRIAHDGRRERAPARAPSALCARRHIRPWHLRAAPAPIPAHDHARCATATTGVINGRRTHFWRRPCRFHILICIERKARDNSAIR